MRRGPEPKKGFDVAIPAALRRGRVMHFRSSPEYVSNFMIYGNRLVILVCLRLATRISRATLAEIRVEYTGALAGLCTVPSGGPVSRELWLYSRHGAMRFFRAGDAGLEEIDRDGVPFVNGKPVGVLPAVQDNPPPPAPAPVEGVPPGPGGADPRSPIIRWLKKMNAMKVQAAKDAAATAQGPGKSPVSGGPEADVDKRAPAEGPAPSPGVPEVSGIPAGIPGTGSLPGGHELPRIPGEDGGGSGG
jgi:hypothetical protein